jgi:hypothetical protein
VAELPLDDVERDSLAGELERVCVAPLVRREPASHAGADGGPPQLGAHRRCRPGAAAGAAVDDAEQRADGEFGAGGEPGAQVLPVPLVHADLAPAAALAPAQQAAIRAAGRGRALRARAPPGGAGRRATGRRSSLAGASRDGHRSCCASRPRSRPRSADRPGSASPCYPAPGRRGSPASSPASDAARPQPRLKKRSRDLLPSDSKNWRCLPSRAERDDRAGAKRVSASAPRAAGRQLVLVQRELELEATESAASRRKEQRAQGCRRAMPECRVAWNVMKEGLPAD